MKVNIINRNLKIFLFIICISSIGLISITDNAVVRLLNEYVPQVSFLAQIRLTSFSICLFIYIISLRLQPQLTIERANWKQTLRTSVMWLLPTIYFVLIKRVWVPHISTWIDIFSFMLTGLLAEELLFRGAIYELTKKAYPNLYIWRFSGPVFISSIFFALQHLGYHHFQINQASITQVIYTFIMGLFFASVRKSSGRLWPVILLHIITNSLTLIRNFWS